MQRSKPPVRAVNRSADVRHEPARQTRQSRESSERSNRQGAARTPVYDFRAIEAKWLARWDATRIYQPNIDHPRRPYYNLMMFPYPSAAGLHVGNMYSYVGSDVHGRWMAMRGYDVFEPIGFDAFGIHSENYAIKEGRHPRELTRENIEHFRAQLRSIGNHFDWSHEVDTSDRRYYRWTQWIFVQLFKAGLVERKLAAVNWCPNDKTVLADEQVIAGRCERCGAVVERRELEQWFFKITRYADRLLNNLDWLDWTQKVKALQRNWIGRSEGLEFEMAVAGSPVRLRTFTTRPDTMFGVTFVALSPEHPALDAITHPPQARAVRSYQQRTRRVAVRAADAQGKGAPTGVFTGSYAIHPFTGEQVPIWVSDYVVGDYATGAVMGVPAHDARDMAFARAVGLPVRTVVHAEGHAVDSSLEAFTGRGALINSGEFSGMTSDAASAAIIEWCERQGIGQRKVRYHLRDWLISRQRYWGPPIPIIHCPEHGAVPVPEDQLPVLLPESEEYRPDGSGSSPLARVESFVQTSCPICGGPARRETDVSDNFLDNSWYFLRYPSSDDAERAWDPVRTRTWLPPGMYIGGAEHSVLHLMYSRFITMALHDLALLEFEEPFPRFRANGTITKNGAKISKSRGKTVNPDAYIERYGADVFRTYLMFMGPYEAGGDFSDGGIGGVVRFLNRVWQLVMERPHIGGEATPPPARLRELHSTIAQATRDIEALKYNTAIAALMKHLNTLEAASDVTDAELRTFVRLLAPFAPFVADELWERLGGKESIHIQAWPEADEAALRAEEQTLVVQVNGRLRDRVTLPAGLSVDDITQRVVASERVRRYVDRRTIQKVVHVPGRLVNIVLDGND